MLVQEITVEVEALYCTYLYAWLVQTHTHVLHTVQFPCFACFYLWHLQQQTTYSD